MNSLSAWSYSKYSCYKLCPFQFKCKYIEKMPQGAAPALERGIKIHDEAERYLKGKLKKVPDSCSKLEKEFKIIKSKGYLAEEAWGFDEMWNPVPFMDKNAFLRMKIDAQGFPEAPVPTIKVIDFKTGKVRNTYQEQVELYITAAFATYDLEIAQTELWFLDHGKITDPVEYNADRFDKLVNKWNRKITPMFNDTKFAPTKNFLCKNYCDFAKHKGGQCKYGD